jgi:hypothetical protein
MMCTRSACPPRQKRSLKEEGTYAPEGGLVITPIRRSRIYEYEKFPDTVHRRAFRCVRSTFRSYSLAERNVWPASLWAAIRHLLLNRREEFRTARAHCETVAPLTNGSALSERNFAARAVLASSEAKKEKRTDDV